MLLAALLLWYYQTVTDEIPWAEVTDSSWVPAFERAVRGLAVRFDGSCPRCTHQTSANFPRVTLGSGLRGDEEPVTMFCKCGYPHSGHPDGDNSCGAYWTYQAEL